MINETTTKFKKNSLGKLNLILLFTNITKKILRKGRERKTHLIIIKNNDGIQLIIGSKK